MGIEHEFFFCITPLPYAATFPAPNSCWERQDISFSSPNNIRKFKAVDCAVFLQVSYIAAAALQQFSLQNCFRLGRKPYICRQHVGGARWLPDMFSRLSWACQNSINSRANTLFLFISKRLSTNTALILQLKETDFPCKEKNFYSI